MAAYNPLQDVLYAAVRAEGETAVGLRYRAALALSRVNSLRCADAMRRLVADPDYALEHMEEGAILLVRLWDCLPCWLPCDCAAGQHDGPTQAPPSTE